MNVPRRVSRILIVANLAKDDAEALLDEIQKRLEARGLAVTIFAFRGKPAAQEIGPQDLAFSLGGDGTVLYCARLLAEKGIPILPVNLGNFGFITEISKDEWEDAFEKYLDGSLRVGERLLLRVNVHREDEVIWNSTALNDLVISSAGIPKLLNLSVCLSEFPLLRYRADGVIVSTPTGSTAYSAAAGGPILHPEMNAMILNPICPFTLSHRPLVIPTDEFIRIRIEPNQKAEVILTTDGQNVFPLKERDFVTAKAADCRVKLIQTDRRTFYTVLKEKLNWSGGSDA